MPAPSAGAACVVLDGGGHFARHVRRMRARLERWQQL